MVPLHGARTAQTYVQVLQEHLVPFILETLPENGVFDAIFQQDNESTHTAHFTERYLTQQEFLTMKFPPCSPDMNPIEHLWAALKKELYRRFPDTPDLPGGPEAVQRALAERLTIVWEDIGPDTMNALINSMPRRVQALIEAKGWYTKY